jgi:hypothetical protein
MDALVKYDAACRALAEAASVDEVKEIRNQARALKHYARMANNRELEADATAIRIRAERRVGEMMEQGKNDRAGHGGDRKSRVPGKPLKPTLTDAGINKSLANRARKLAALSRDDFEALVSRCQEDVRRTNVIVRTAPATEHNESSEDTENESENENGGEDAAAPEPSDEERWQESMRRFAGGSIAMRAAFKKYYGEEWETFTVPSDLVTLAEQAMAKWQKLVSELRNRQRSDAQPSGDTIPAPASGTQH